MKKRSTIISVAQQKGGTGKTTIAAHIAIALLQQGNKVAIIDTDPQESLTQWYNTREKKLGKGYGGLHLSTKSGWRVQNEILSLDKFDYIIIDSPAQNNSDAKNAFRDADLVLIPLQPSPTDLWATRSTIAFCESNNIPYKIIINRLTPNSKLLSHITAGLKNILPTMIGNRVAFASAMLTGHTVTETHPSTTCSSEIKALVKDITKTVKKIKS